MSSNSVVMLSWRNLLYSKLSWSSKSRALSLAVCIAITLAHCSDAALSVKISCIVERRCSGSTLLNMLLASGSKMQGLLAAVLSASAASCA